MLWLVVVVADSFFRWMTFQYGSFDLAFYDQAFWLALQGKWHVSVLDVSLMGNHAEPITFLLLPLYSIWPHPMLMVLVQAVALASMPATALRIGTSLALPQGTSICMAGVTLLLPATGFVGLHEFHPEAFSAPLLLLMLEARLRGQSGRHLLWALMAVACKENIALLVAWYALVGTVLDRNRGWSWLRQFYLFPGILALFWAGLYALVLSPWWNGGRVAYGTLYSHLGNGAGDMLLGVFTRPQVILGHLSKAIFSDDLMAAMLVPLLFLCCFRPRWLLVSAPILAQHLLSERPSEWSVRFHYAAPLIPLFWFAACEAIAAWQTRATSGSTSSRLIFALAPSILCACCVWQITRGPATRIIDTWRESDAAIEGMDWKQPFIASISPDASVFAGNPYLSHLSHREHLHASLHLLSGLSTLGGQNYHAPEFTDFVILDFGDTRTFNRSALYFHDTLRAKDGRIIPSSDQLLVNFAAKSVWDVTRVNSMVRFTRIGPVPSVDGSYQIRSKVPQSNAESGIVLGDFARAFLIADLDAKDWQFTVGATFEKLGPIWGERPWAHLHLRRSGEASPVWSMPLGPVGLGQSDVDLASEWNFMPPSSLANGTYEASIDFVKPFETQSGVGIHLGTITLPGVSEEK